MLCLALRLDLLGLHDLDGGVVEHLLPGVIECPIVGVGQESLLGEGDRLLGGRVHAGGPLIVCSRRLTLLLCLLAQLQSLVVGTGLQQTEVLYVRTRMYITAPRGSTLYQGALLA